MGMSLVLQVFGHKPKYWTHYGFDLLMALDEETEDHQSFYNSSWGMHECLHQISWQSIQYLWRNFTQNRKCQPRGGTTGKVKSSPKSLGYIVWVLWMSVHNVGPIHLVNVEIFHRIGDKFDLLVALKVKSEHHQVIRVHPLRTIKVCAKFHGSSCWAISVWTKVDGLTNRTTLPSLQPCCRAENQDVDITC